MNEARRLPVHSNNWHVDDTHHARARSSGGARAMTDEDLLYNIAMIAGLFALLLIITVGFPK